MPQYRYECRQDLDGCGHIIDFECLMSELDDNRPKSCPKCRKRKSLQPILFTPTVNIPNTLGSRADKNTDTISADEQHHLTKEHNAYKEESAEPSWVSTEKGMVHKDSL